MHPLQKYNSYLCVIVCSKFQANFLIMRRRPRAYVHIVRAHCLLAIAATATGVINCLGYSKWLRLRVMLYVRSSAAYSGYHVYHRIWHPIVGKVLGTTRERENEHDRYAVAVLEEETCVVGHLPRLISRECYFFLRTGGTITAEVTGRRRCSDLPDGCLDIPISAVFARHCYDFMTRLNCVSQILIMHQPTPRGNLNYTSK